MKMLKFKVLLHKLFPRLYKVEETLEEISVEMQNLSSGDYMYDTPYILWKVFEEESDIHVKVKHTYTRKGVEIGSTIETVTVPYMFSHAEPYILRPVSGATVEVDKLQGMPVFQLKGQMYDVLKIGYPDYMSMVIKKGKVLERAKNLKDIDDEYETWLEELEKNSEEIMANARC